MFGDGRWSRHAVYLTGPSDRDFVASASGIKRVPGTPAHQPQGSRRVTGTPGASASQGSKVTGSHIGLASGTERR